ncbi:ABC transporter permease subunit [Clostridium tyrobutyricum]|mgnify:CR=1 FL=1|jgi:sn-glycerol 3-phosphate transport system permease protein|uniref:Glycerol-3-phosphate ABC transporter, permease protein UgpE (TC 3.A.1.1.3) n=1 Tax=Clostridium tyrobutyricum DIVETGP TaxID=1408889 RepID=W6N531_CLOTY|nr:carbohydrate ABC transporter permease [Clostridium tyrobutyricum]AND85991.1 ABC transporter, permease protein [Clostridium tyrobutyricum]ANP70469.1 ABC transporter permease [Clostridium tyrobutyricum]MBR9647492.1 carbohydrate ABC transporter permease [Clostridium tyrobutyricum]MBV4414738.1 carbohydrate ABC transporter permease [Clostridium tyrobutyricum]MBV4422343.1 carbohydrate ABC transporter permease [Clostridium tyrobutyricum]
MNKNLSKTILYVINIILGLITVAPIIYTVLMSFTPPDQIFSYPPKLIPKRIYFKNYIDALNTAPIIRFIINSFIVSLGVTIGQIVTACLAAFAFSFFNFKGKKILFLAVIATMMIPGETTIMSNYLTIGSFGWVDSYKALIIPYLSAAMGIFMMRQYYLTLPVELYEAAKIDGCGSFKFFTRIVLPMSRPIVGSLGIYTFLVTWNQYMWPLLVTSKDSSRTVQIGIGMLQSVDNQSFGPIMAGIVMILLPSIVIFIIGQKQLIEGMTSGAVKG